MPHSTLTVNRIAVNGAEIDVAPLETIDYGRLSRKEPDEVQKLLNACQTPGFFQLDLRNGSMSSVPAAVEDVYEVAKKFFSQSHEVKMKEYRETQERGYKPGEDDETFEISDDETRQKTLVLPTPLSEHTDLLTQLAHNGQTISKTLLSCLSDALNSAPSPGRHNSSSSSSSYPNLESYHNKNHSSDSGLKLYYEPAKPLIADVKDNEHTDSGTLTLFFYKQWNIQLLLPSDPSSSSSPELEPEPTHTPPNSNSPEKEKKWAFIPPKQGHVLVNVANTLQTLTHKRLTSCLHRVTQPNDGFEKRFFVAYFLRPGHDTTTSAHLNI